MKQTFPDRDKIDISDEDQIRGSGAQEEKESLMNSLLEDDSQTKDEGQLLQEMTNQGLSSFVPDMMFEQMVSSYKTAKQIYGESMLRQLTGYDPDVIQKNIKIPEFKRELKEKMKKTLQNMRRKKLLNKDNTISKQGKWLSAITLLKEELKDMETKGLIGKKLNKKRSHYGEKLDIKNYVKGDRYKDLALKQSIKNSIRRGHSKLMKEDLKTFTRQSKGKISIIYGIDCSGSMKGDKLTMSKKAGLALAYTAIRGKDEVGMIVFGKEINSKINPTTNFQVILDGISDIKATDETDLALTIKTAINMFPNSNITKHLILLTDALPTVGDDPIKATMEAANRAKAAGITISFIGIQLDQKGKELADKITRITDGKLYMVKDVNQLDRVVITDYYSQ